MSEYLSIFHKSHPFPCRRENLPPPALHVDFCEDARFRFSSQAQDGVQMMRRLTRHPIRRIFQLLYLSTVFSKSLILSSCCCTCALNCTTSDFRLIICPASIPICTWIPSSRGAKAPLIAATIAFASDESCKAGASGRDEESPDKPDDEDHDMEGRRFWSPT